MLEKNNNNKYSKQNNLNNELIAYKKEVKTNKNFNRVTIINWVFLGIVITYDNYCKNSLQ